MSRFSRVRSRCIAFLHEVYMDDVEIYRKPRGTEVLADSHHPNADKILREFGFEEPQGSRHHFRLPEGLSEAEKKARAPQAAMHLIAARHSTNLDLDLICPAAGEAARAEIYGNRPRPTPAA
ncbi:hypothetical protein [Streptomyces sp. NPDC059008]|uniref:hypothetical protein n=1 Tax=unclassified Streptomyces TaxID=2593676 RepID=UPI0036C30285